MLMLVLVLGAPARAGRLGSPALGRDGLGDRVFPLSFMACFTISLQAGFLVSVPASSSFS